MPFVQARMRQGKIRFVKEEPVVGEKVQVNHPWAPVGPMVRTAQFLLDPLQMGQEGLRRQGGFELGYPVEEHLLRGAADRRVFDPAGDGDDPGVGHLPEPFHRPSEVSLPVSLVGS